MFVSFLLATVAFAEENNKESDPFDISKLSEQVESVNKLEEESKVLYLAGDCNKAIPKLEVFSKQANWLANLISSGLDPYYGASYDDRKGFHYSKLQPLIPIEKSANAYKKKRNIAIAMQGICYSKIGEKNNAVVHLKKALDLIGIDNEEWWTNARNELFSIIQYNP
jgi:tetratricopeptide (TPR) repeat protein